jgi:dipeptide/tripeptide permease
MPKKKEDRIQLGKANYGLLIISAIILILGYVIMSFNEITISPILLVAAYVIIIPIALLWRPAQK